MIKKFQNSTQNTNNRCIRCVLPKSLSQVEFSEEGLCALCQHSEPQSLKETSEPNKDIEPIIEQIRVLGKGRPFDCLVGLSGGRDSTYLLYLLTQKHHLRVLAAYYRTPFTHQIIDENVRKIVKQLNVPLVEMRISQQKHLEIARRFFSYWLRRPSLELANLACAPCKLVNREVHRIARSHRIRSIVYGGNKSELVQFVPTFQYNNGSAAQSSFWEQTKKMFGICRNGMRVIIECPSLLQCLPLCSKSALLYLDFGTSYLRMRYPEIQRVDYFHTVSLNESEANRVVSSVLGWTLPPDCTTTWRADCDFADLKNYMFEKVCGATYTDGYLSNLIRAGQMTREDALSQLHNGSYISWNRVRRALHIMGLPEDTIRP